LDAVSSKVQNTLIVKAAPLTTFLGGGFF